MGLRSASRWWRYAAQLAQGSGACSTPSAAQLQQQCLHQRIMSQLAPSTARRGAATFTPSRLYPKQQGWTPEAATLWGLAAANVAAVLLAKTEVPEAQEFVLRHLRTSVEAVYDGRYHTLATAMFAHYSAVHCAINWGMLLLFRRVQQLQAAEVGGACPACACIGDCGEEGKGERAGSVGVAVCMSVLALRATRSCRLAPCLER